MIIICGVPRSASTFLCKWFNLEGNNMSPKCYSDFMPAKQAREQGLEQQLCEPYALTHDMTRDQHYAHDQIIAEVDNIEKFNLDKANGKEQVLKCAQFVFYKYCLHRFDTVIVCTRDKESWIKSAKNNGTFAWIYRARPYWINPTDYFCIINNENPEQAFYYYWYAHSKRTIKYCLSNNIPVINYEYADDESFMRLHEYFGLKVRKHIDYNYWNLRRF